MFDLDPGPPAGLAQACLVGLRVRALLTEDGLASTPKTSGGKGLHVFVPLARGAAYEQTKAYARGLAERLARDTRTGSPTG